MSELITYTGKLVNILNPKPEDIDVKDIAHSLANQCRFGGHCKEFYSVADHSLMVSRILGRWDAPPIVLLQGLLRDASEAYVVDVPRPLKLNLEGYKHFEKRIQAAICERFNLGDMDPVIKRADIVALAVESDCLMPNIPGAWPKQNILVPVDVLVTQDPNKAEWEFLSRFNSLKTLVRRQRKDAELERRPL